MILIFLRLDESEDDLLPSTKFKAGLNLLGIEYYEGQGDKLTGHIEFKKKNIRLQNRQLKLNDASKQFLNKSKHIYFDDDGNAINETTVDAVFL